MTQLSPEALAGLVEQVRELLPKVTPGEWRWEGDSLCAKKGKKDISVIKVIEGFEWDEYSSELASIKASDEDRALIALAPTMAAAVLALEAKVTQLKSAVRMAAEIDTKVEPTWQCPNCGEWQRNHSPRCSSSGPHDTLYGVCKKCADGHAEFNDALARSLTAPVEKEKE